MKIIEKSSMAAIALGIFIACAALSNEAAAQERGGRRHGPPPEAYTACEDKSEGDAAEFVSPRGDTVTGTCEYEGDRLVLRPDNPPPRGGGRNDGDE